MTHAAIDSNLCRALHFSMHRVDQLRMKLNMSEPLNVLEEFLMRRALLRARYAMQQSNEVEAMRMLRVLKRFEQP